MSLLVWRKLDECILHYCLVYNGRWRPVSVVYGVLLVREYINPVLLFMTLFCSRCFVTGVWECVYYAIIVLLLCSHESLCKAVQLTVFSIWKLHWNFILASSVNCIFELYRKYCNLFELVQWTVLSNFNAMLFQ